MNDNKNNNQTAVSATNMESVIGDESMAKKKTTGLDTPVSIHVHSKRHRLCDADGISAKAAIDGLVHGGLLQDDSAKHVKEVSYSQEKIPKSQEEETVLIITAGN